MFRRFAQPPSNPLSRTLDPLGVVTEPRSYFHMKRPATQVSKAVKFALSVHTVSLAQAAYEPRYVPRLLHRRLTRPG